ncbi:GNAT family N-acetyltransferase [bacterium]|nr:GNAT family N-acetyltransferase [candidate division CSSED10-310 bacterium]
MTNLTIKRMGPEDLEQARDNCTLFWKMNHAIANLKAFLADPGCILLTAEIDGNPAGQVTGYILRRWDSKKPKLFLYSIDVLESHRRKGVARQLITEFRRIGKEAGCGAAFVFTNASNIPAMLLYQYSGGVRTYSDDVMFEWSL